MAQQTGYAIEEIYRGVIGDVVNQVREAFLDEGVDIEVLQQLKRSWESKIQASGAVDLDNRQPAPAPPPITKQSRQQQASLATNNNTSSTPQPSPVPENALTLGTSTSSKPNRVQSLQKPMLIEHQPAVSTQNPIQLLSLPMPTQMLAAGSRMQLPPGLLPGTQYAVVDGPNGTQSLVLLNPSQMQLSLETQAQFLLQQQNSGNNSSAFRRPTHEVATKKEPSSGHVPQQMDGGGSGSGSSFRVKETKEAKKGNNIKRITKKIPQLDGGGPGMTDSSSEEEQDDDDHLNRFAGLEDETGDKLDEVDEDDDEPLNSGDDQSDDEDLDTLFDADNVVVCQFEKVHRARNKWKFNLKDGVMQVKGKDYCFHKSTGEAEW